MNDEKLYQIWVYLQSEPLFWLTLTLGAYITGEKVYKSSKLFPLFNPVAISIIIISAILIFFNVSYERYFSGAIYSFSIGSSNCRVSNSNL